jgi:hypothetical protein
MQSAGRGLELTLTRGEVDRVKAVPTVGGAAASGHEPAVAKQAEVVRDEALRFSHPLGQLSHGPIAAHELAQQSPPQRVGGQPDECGWRIQGGSVHVANLLAPRHIDQMQLMY